MASQGGGASKRRVAHTRQAVAADPPPRERIAAAAVALLDDHGIEGLTMRRLSDALGVGVMSLYWHVKNKEDVFDLALDTVLAYRPASRPSKRKGWRGEVHHLLQDWRAAMLRHPWSAALLPRRALGPSILARLERLGDALARAGVADADLNTAIWSLWNSVMGATITRASFGLSQGDQAEGQGRLAQQGERYVTIERSRLLLDDNWDAAFEQGIDFLLDGIALGRTQP